MARGDDVQITVTTNDKASKGLKDVGDAATDLDGKAGGLLSKIPGVGGALDKLGASGAGMGTLLAGGAAVGVAAVGALAVKALSAFSDAALAAEKGSIATGLSTDAYSRLAEVSEDVGGSSESLTKMLTVLGKTAANNPKAFADLSVEIAKTDTGATDIQGTFQNVVDRLNAIEDPAARGAAAAKLLGKGWQENGELIKLGGDKIKQAMAAVSDAKAIDDEEVQKAKDMRAAFDTLVDAGQDVLLILGEALMPIVTQVAEKFAKVAEVAGPLATAVGDLLAGAFEACAPVIDFLVDALAWAVEKMTAAAEAAQALFDILGGSVDGVVGNTDILKQAAAAADEKKVADEEASVAAEEQAEAIDLATASLEEQKKQTDENVKSQEALISAMRSAVDADYAVRDATDSYNEELAELDAKLAAAGEGSAEYDKALRDVTQSAAEVADATVRAREEQDKANGITTTAKQKQDEFNASMLASAASASGPARQSIIDYVAEVNGIPPSKATEIQAMIDSGDLAGAEAALNDASRARKAAINADTDKVALAQAEDDLANLTKPRSVQIRGAVSGAGGIPKYATGTNNHPGGLAVVNDGGGGEIIDLPSGARVYPAGLSAQMVAGGGSGGAVNHYSISVTAEPGADGYLFGQKVVSAIKNFERANGQSWRD